MGKLIRQRDEKASEASYFGQLRYGDAKMNHAVTLKQSIISQGN